MAQLSAEQIREKFGLDYNEKHANSGGKGASKYGGRDDGAIFDDETGAYVGTLKNFTPKDESKKGPAGGIDAYEAIEDYGVKHGFRGDKRQNWNRMNDVAGAVNDILEGGDEAPKPEGPKEPDAPVSVSPKLAEARTRVQQYEEDVLSGRGVYGKKSFEQNDGPSFLDRYKLKLKENYKENDKGDYVATRDQERYDADMDEYNRKKAEFDAQQSSLGN